MGRWFRSIWHWDAPALGSEHSIRSGVASLWRANRHPAGDETRRVAGWEGLQKRCIDQVVLPGGHGSSRLLRLEFIARRWMPPTARKWDCSPGFRKGPKRLFEGGRSRVTDVSAGHVCPSAPDRFDSKDLVHDFRHEPVARTTRQPSVPETMPLPSSVRLLKWWPL